MTRACRRLPTIFNAVGVAACLMLGACGGGGGSTAGGSAGPGASAGTMVMSSDDFPGYPMRAVSASEKMVGLAQFVTDMSGRFVRKGSPLTVVVRCTDGIGTAALTLTDRDGDGIASKGDRLAISASNCKLGGLFDSIQGDVTFELNGATAVRSGTVEGDVQIASGVTGSPRSTWGGGFHTLQSRTALAQSWRITTPDGGFSFLPYTVQGGLPDTLRSVNITKSVDYETAKSTLSLAMVFDSRDGTLNVSTTTPIIGYLQRPADTGEMHFQAANGVVILTSAHTDAGWDVRLKMTFGTHEYSSQSYPWTAMTYGIMWWDGLRRANGSDDIAVDMRDYAADALRVELIPPPVDLMTTPDTVYQVQFLRPPVDLPSVQFRFEDIDGIGESGWDVPATAERHGAAILLRPAEPLRSGRRYTLTTTLNGVPWTVKAPQVNSGPKLHDAQGHELVLDYIGGELLPIDLLINFAWGPRSMASLAEKITLNASVVPVTGAKVAPARYHWSQVNGTPLRFSDPDALVTTVSLGDVRPAGVETVQLQLTVTDSLGGIHTDRIAITVGEITGRRPFMRINGLPYLNGGGVTLEAPIAFTPSYVPTQYTDRFRNLDTVPNEIWDVQFGLPSGTVLAIGSYAFNGAGVALAANAPDMILQSPREAACTTRSGTFKILDVEYGVDGAPVRLAIDFTIRCNGGPELFGNYRHNSSIPAVDTRTNN